LLDDGTTVVVMRAIVHVGDLVNDFCARFRALLATADSAITSH
jgi:hypothetical protein